MNSLLIEMPLYLGLPLFMVIVAVIGNLIYLGMRKSIQTHLDKQHERVGRVLFRTSASLLALILSLTFANQRVDYIKIQNAMEVEAAQIVDVHIDLGLYDTPEATELQAELRRYISNTASGGWRDILEDYFYSQSFRSFHKVYSGIYTLEATSELQRDLKKSMIADIDEISDNLQIRIYTTQVEPLNLIYTSVFGIVAVMIFFSVYEPNRLNLLFVSVYAMFIGLVLYFVLMMSNPLRGPLQVEPKPFKLLQETIEQSAERR